MNNRHPSHVTRVSDASSFDEVCINCNATDGIGTWGELAYPCRNAPPTDQERCVTKGDMYCSHSYACDASPQEEYPGKAPSKAAIKPSPSVVTRTINRFARAVENKAFDGTIPWDSEAACAAHAEIDKELAAAEKSLRRLIERASR